MKRRAIVVAGLTLAAAGVAGTVPALAAGPDAVSVSPARTDNNGCVVIIPLKLALCIPRL